MDRSANFSAVTILLIVLFCGCTEIEPVITYVDDVDNNRYDVIRIGSQLWMKENLRVTRYRNGELIGTTDPATKDITSETSPKYQWASNNEEGSVGTYGRIYTWSAIMDKRKICPVGWHVPSHNEWMDLSDYLGGLDIAGGKLKEAGLAHWNSPNTDATNESGFTAIPGGYRNPGGIFWTKGRYDVWWSSTPTSALKALHWGVGYIYAYFYCCEELRSQAVSVRCIKDH